MKKINVVLVGQPNVGKSLLINALCKANMKVGNFPGVTVEKAVAKAYYKDYEIKFIDLPGTYALDGYSEEEKITKNYIENENYDIIVNVLDSTNLERNLALSMQLLDINKKMILALNMQDEAHNEGAWINDKALEELLKIPCISVSAKTKQNLNSLLELIIQNHEKQFIAPQRIYSDVIENELDKITEFLNNKKLNHHDLSNRQFAFDLLLGKQQSEFDELNSLINSARNRLFMEYDTQDLNMIFRENLMAFAKAVAMKVLSQSKKRIKISPKILMLF